MLKTDSCIIHTHIYIHDLIQTYKLKFLPKKVLNAHANLDFAVAALNKS